jgi:hypothetical protein
MKSNLSWDVTPCSHASLLLGLTLNLNMEAGYSCGKSVSLYQAIWRHIP